MNAQTVTDLTIARESAMKRLMDIESILAYFETCLERKASPALEILISDMREDAAHLSYIADELERIAKDELNANA